MTTAEAGMTVAIRLKREHIDAMVAHALEDAPIECCGLLAAKDGVVAAVRRAKNKEASPYRFSIDPLETRKHEQAIDDAGMELVGFYHSHTGSHAVPSPTDIRMMGPFFGPPFVHFVIGVADREKPEVRVWHIDGSERVERTFQVVD
ncbi:MAG: M67 family metallopeptidase [Dehalococcoidia bacterium]|jgi:proteasome lid subunit RPN8/RPN11|uniref:M67 family metallopeptidase n=1 Tax=Candidatus Amarobacter glycogenicus TaxID=3140699 RepID=UPI002A137921|nr:M67 family metallopeptidase [Dehalococcoidia bacterium]MBK6563215.1 M67 family metallopeptidase [Dehalococcoidia bacterium]MBK7126228.1 M67 family metallopeptidase [Dehalococcoidia bacterium]MBK7329797.1 M67 family metallopeptidase [Dehalococcoidia bacterium]MBK8560364.1 M67 family metallopeptidase [Dehalococcoidia bacterium]